MARWGRDVLPGQVTKLACLAGDLTARGLTLPQDFVTFQTSSNLTIVRWRVRPGGRRRGRRRRLALVAAGEPGKDARWVAGDAGHPDMSRTRWQALDRAWCWPRPGRRDLP
jgi:hypothetical protein